MASRVALRALSNNLDAVYNPSDTDNLFSNDWYDETLDSGDLADAIMLSVTGINTAQVEIGGTVRLNDVGGAELTECNPDVDNLRNCGDVALRWLDIYGVNLHGDGAGLTSVLLLTGGTMIGDVDMNAVNRVRNAADPVLAQDYATRSWVLTQAGGGVPSPGGVGEYLRSTGAAWASATLDVDDVGAGVLGAAYGGTDQSTVTDEDLLVGTTGTAWTKLAVGSPGDVLTVNSGPTVAWAAPAAPSLALSPVSVSTTPYAISTADPAGSAYVVTTINPSQAVTLPAPATVGAGWWCFIKDGTGTANNGANRISVDPNVAETIDGASSADITNTWQTRVLMTDGTNWLLW